jgi:hypothetical protein
MRKKNSTRFLRSFLCCTLAALAILQGSASLFAQGRIDANLTPIADEPKSTISDGYEISEKTAGDVNAFLSQDPARGEVTEALAANGVNPDDVKYVRVASDPLRTAADDLDSLAGTVRNADPQISTVEMWIGGAEAAPDSPVGAVLLVGNRTDGTQTLLNYMVANDAAMSGNAAEAKIGNGDFYSSDAVAADGRNRGVIGVAFLLCWIKCFLVVQVLIQLRCIIVTIIVCWRLGPFIICVGVRLVICQIRIWIRIFVVCYIRCILVIIVVPLPPGANKEIGAGTLDGYLMNPPWKLGKPDKGSRGLPGGRPVGRTMPFNRQIPALT